MAESSWAGLLDGIAERIHQHPGFVTDLMALREITEGEPQKGALLPIQRDWPMAGAADDLGRRMADVDRRLGAGWRQNPNYRAKPPSSNFLQNYGYLECAGPDAPYRYPRLRLGLLLLGADTLYPQHHHPAEEIYLPLGDGLWWKDGDGWQARSSGDVIHHPPMCRHATQSGNAPLAAIYLWRGEIAQAAKIG